MVTPTVTREVVLDASVDEVWRALTDSDELSAWFGGEVTLDPTPGGTGTFDDGRQRRRAEVEEIEPEHRFSFRWWPEQDDTASSRVEFTIDEVGEGTRLLVVETPAPAGARAPRHGAQASAAPCSLQLATVAWDDRLLGLELHCIAGRFAARLALV
jgi:uncharacterized protein YndB with AHSA1/START domain